MTCFTAHGVFVRIASVVYSCTYQIRRLASTNISARILFGRSRNWQNGIPGADKRIGVELNI
jgi:hypothetical protein